MDGSLDTKRIGLGMLAAIFVLASFIFWMGAKSADAGKNLDRSQSASMIGSAGNQTDESAREIEAYLNKEMLVGVFEHDAGWANRRWGRNPFLAVDEIRFFKSPALRVAGDRIGGESKRPEPAVKIVLIAGDRKVALVEGGDLISIGDRIENELVAAIDIEGVALADGHGKRRIDLPQSSIAIAADRQPLSEPATTTR